MKVSRMLAAALAVGMLLTSCSGEAEITSDEGADMLSGVFNGEAVELDESFGSISAMSQYSDKLYITGMMNDKEPTLAVVDTQDISISYETIMSDGDLDGLAVSDTGYLYISIVFDSTTVSQIFTLACESGGEIKWEKPLSDFITLPENYWDGVFAEGSQNDGWFVCADETLAVIDIDGTLVKSHTLPGGVDGMARAGDGSIHVWSFGGSRGTAFHCVLDESETPVENTKWLEAQNTVNARSGGMYFGEGANLYYITETGLYSYDIGSEESEIVINWVNSSVLASNINSMAIISPETIFIYGGVFTGSDLTRTDKAVMLYTKSENVTSDGIELITVTYIENGTNEIPLAAIAFNQSQSRYKVVCDEYTSTNRSDDYIELYSSFDMYVVSGGAGDIIVTNTGLLDAVKYAQKGLFADLYGLMDEFGEAGGLTEDNLFGCVKKAYELDGGLYMLPREFELATLAADISDTGDGGWNTEDFIKIAESLPDGRKMLWDMSKSSVYNTLRDSVISEHIDLENGVCDFELENFMDFLEYIASLPETDNSGYGDSENHFITGEVVCYSTKLGSYAQYAKAHSLFGKDANVELKEYPSASGGAAKLNAHMVYSINEASEHKEGSMSFLNFFFSPECMINEYRKMMSFPSLKTTMSAWDAIESLMYYFFYYNNTGRISGSHNPIEGDNGVCVAMDDVLISETVEFCDTVDVFAQIPQSIIDIVDEDISAFLASAKTAEETARLIQSRVSLYLSERS
jgi:ABC-type glycerol-3-phosphate transport system substrate-binding protein